jgi:hypothetical protein
VKTISFILILISITSNCFSQNNALKTSYPFDLETLKKLSDNLLQNDSVAPVYLSGGFTYINTKSKLPVIEGKFEEAYPFEGDFGLIKVHGKYGIVNRNGDFVVKPTFPRFQLFWVVNYGISFDENNYFSFSQGKLIKVPEILCAEPVSPQLYYYKQGQKFGLIFKADTIKKPVFDSVYANTDRIAIVSQSGKIFIVDYTGKVLLKLNYKSYVGPTGYNSTLTFALKQKDTWHYFSGNKKLFENKFQPALSGGVFLVSIDKRYNYLDGEGNLLLSKNYKWISNNGVIAINENDNIVFLLKGKKELTYY